jgi:hypothetical protein
MTGTSKLLFSVLSPLALLLQPTHDRPLVRIGETNMDISSAHGITTNTCVMVQPDGHFHLEVRVQRLPSPTATLHIYEGNLGEFQMLRLQSLLDARGLRDAEDFQAPQLPLTVPAVKVAIAEITREDHIQKVGYLAWNERKDGPTGRPESEPASVEEQWQRSRMLLTPLLEWAHAMQLVKMSELPESASTLCEYDSSPE